MIAWNAPFWALVAAAIAVLVWRPPIPPLERALGFFGVGAVDAAVASAIVLATSGLVGHLYNVFVPTLVASGYSAVHFVVALATGAATGFALARVASRFEGDDEP
jgi:hypothetical protein